MAILAECPVCHRRQATRNKACCSCGEDLDQAKQSGEVKYWIDYRLPGGKQRREVVGYSIKEARIAEGKHNRVQKEDEICGECNKDVVYIKKRQLCMSCYQALKRTEYKNNKGLERPVAPSTLKQQQHTAEIDFVKNFFCHQNWLYQPAMFHLNGTNYTPDFFDGETGTFIEVVGTRQAYHANKDKYLMFQKMFGSYFKFEVRKKDGSLIDLENDDRIDWQ